MDIDFFDPEDLPAPPGEVRLREVRAAPYLDGRRVKLGLRLTPFQQRPDLEITVFNAPGDEVASMSIVQAMHHHFDLTLHLREARPAGEYRVEVSVHYSDQPPVDVGEARFHLPVETSNVAKSP